MADGAQLPLPLTAVRDGARVELEHLSNLIVNLSPADWSVASAAAGWTIGEVVAHLDLFLDLYNRLVARLLAGDPFAGAVSTVDRLALSAMPRATPVFNAVNGAIPRALARFVPPASLRSRFLKCAGRTRELVLRAGPDADTGPGHHKRSPTLVSFYLAIVVNELALHGWDMESELGQAAGLSDSARVLLPWFYWSATKLLLRLPRGTNGTVRVVLSEPAAAMWWSIVDGSAVAGRALASRPEATIRVSSGDFVLGVAGRLRPADILDSPTAVEGDRALAECFLRAWHLI